MQEIVKNQDHRNKDEEHRLIDGFVDSLETQIIAVP